MEKTLKFALNVFSFWAVISMYVWAARDFLSVPSYIALFLRLIVQCIAIYLLILPKGKIRIDATYGLVVLWMLYSSVITIINPHLPRELAENLWWPCVFILFYHVAAYSELAMAFLRQQLPRLILASILIFPCTYLAFSYGDKQASNYIFFVVLLLPSLFFIKERLRLRYYLLGVMCSVLAFKRSGVLMAAVVGLAIVYFDYLKSTGKRAGLKRICSFVLVVAMGLVFFVVDAITGGHMASRFASMEEDGGSGRDIIYEYVIAQFGNLPIEKQVFGIGFNGVINHEWIEHRRGAFVSAHNDFLEILCDFGYVGTILYFGIIMRLIFNVRVLRKKSVILYRCNVTYLSVFLIASMISHLFLYPTYFAFLMIPWAITSFYVANRDRLISLY